jgi:peptidoglycan hydrolase-like protein with peptidoglycan-binding domain
MVRVGMRAFAGLLAVLLATSVTLAQDSPAAAPKADAKPDAAKPKPKPKAQAGKPTGPGRAAPDTSSAAPVATPASQSVKDSYAAFTVAERIALQSDLVWSGDYNGLINGEFSDRLVAAVKQFQRRNKTKDTGVLNPQERAVLAAVAKPLKDEVGWRLADDPATGARLGLPLKLASQAAPGGSGTRWSSAQGQLQIETFRVVGATMESVFEQQKRQPVGRRAGYTALRPDFFVVSGTQGLKKFYVRASAKDGEVRGLTVLYDQAMEGTMDSVVVAMSSAFMAFPTALAAADSSAARRRVEYGTGLVASAAGHIVTDRQVVDGCQVIVVPGLGHAERLAEDRASDLALLRVYGARNLTPFALIGAAPDGSAATLVGIADPQAQAGASAVTTVSAKLGPAASPRPLEQAPALGFSGAAAIDPQGRFFGMVVLKGPMVAGPSAAPQAVVVAGEKVMNFLEANYVAPSSGHAGVESAKASVVRVICVRK